MNRSIISKRVASILDDIQRMTNTLYALNTTDIQRYPDNYEVLSTDAALRAEGIACRLRHLIYTTTGIKKPVYLDTAADALGIEVHYKKGIFEIVLPGLVPKRKAWQSAEYILDPLHAALTRYARERALPVFHHCVIAFSHIYDGSLPERRVRDYDNLELKQIQDVIAAYVLTDDTGLLCDSYHTTELGEVDLTRISIMENAHFPDWLHGRLTSDQGRTEA